MIDTRFLFEEITESFIADLEKIPCNNWIQKTCYPTWTVKDIISHLIQTSLSRLSRQRDKYPNNVKPQKMDFDNLSELIFNSNNLWYQNFNDISPEIIFEIFKFSERALSEFMKQQKLNEELFFPVSWVDESYNQNWIDIGREYTERWNHQQQIREALCLPLLNNPKYLEPVIQIIFYALPKWFNDLPAKIDTLVRIDIIGESGGTWFLKRDKEFWIITNTIEKNTENHISLSEEIFWKFMMRTISPDEASKEIIYTGDYRYYQQFLKSKAVMMKE